MPIVIGVAVIAVLFLSSKAGVVFKSYDDLYKKYALKYGLDWKMLKAIAQIESTEGRHPLVMLGKASEDGLSYGLMQVTLTTARDYDKSVTPEKLNNPEYSINIASQHLKMLSRMFPNQIEWIVKSYNQGQGNSLREKSGKSQGFAHNYWVKYQKAYEGLKNV